MPPKITPRATLIRVQELHDAGNSFRKIAEILAAEGVPAAGTRSKWHHDSVRWCLEQIEQRSESSATWGLSPQIRARLAAQGEEIEGLTVAGVHRLGRSIQETVGAELQAIQSAAVGQTRKVEAQLETIQGAAERQARLVRAAFGWLWIWILLGGLVFSLGLGGGAWVVGDWMAGDIQSWRVEVKAARATLSKIEEKTWGVEFRETPTGRFLILPKDEEQPKTWWTIEERDAVKVGK